MRLYPAIVAIALAACVSSSPEGETGAAGGPREDAVRSTAAAQGRVLGLLSLPQVFGDQPCATYAPSEIIVYAAPDSARPLGAIRVSQPWIMHPNGGCEGLRVVVHLASADSAAELPTLEHDYETQAAVVLAQRDDWFRIRLAEGSAWIRRSKEARFFPLQELLLSGLTYIAEPDGKGLSSAPGAADRGIAVDLLTEGRSVRLLDTKSVGGDLWLKLAVHGQSPCESADEPKSVAEGWLPAHTATGEPIVWFYSRGC